LVETAATLHRFDGTQLDALTLYGRQNHDSAAHQGAAAALVRKQTPSLYWSVTGTTTSWPQAQAGTVNRTASLAAAGAFKIMDRLVLGLGLGAAHQDFAALDAAVARPEALRVVAQPALVLKSATYELGLAERAALRGAGGAHETMWSARLMPAPWAVLDFAVRHCPLPSPRTDKADRRTWISAGGGWHGSLLAASALYTWKTPADGQTAAQTLDALLRAPLGKATTLGLRGGYTVAGSSNSWTAGLALEYTL